MKPGAFCELHGSTIKNRVLEYLLENQELGIAVGDMARELGISRPKAYHIMQEFEKNNYVKKSRVVGKTQLYILNKDNVKVQLLMKHFMDCLRLIAEEEPQLQIVEYAF